MKTTMFRLALTCAAASLSGACATVNQRNHEWWPTPIQNVNVCKTYKFEPVASVEEATANIRNLQNTLRVNEVANQIAPASIEIDRFSIRLLLKWTRMQTVVTNGQTVVIGEGLFESDHTAIQTSTSAVPVNAEATVVIPLKGIHAVVLWGDGISEFRFDTGVMRISTGSRANAQRFADSVLTLAGENHNKPYPNTGIVPRNLDQEEKDELKLDHGIITQRLEINSPADKAGIEVGDVIEEMNGAPTNTIDDFDEMLKAGNPIKFVVTRFILDPATGDLVQVARKTMEIVPLVQ